MKYQVRTKDGELTYGSLEEVKTAYVLGLIDTDDEVLEENTTLWRKAGAIPLLVTAKKVDVDRGQSRTLLAWTTAAILASVTFFFLIVKGFVSGFVVVLVGIPVAGLLIRVSTMAARRKK